MAVAMAVKTGSATTGLGIRSAAKALDLDFINVAYEDYDFLVDHNSLDYPQIVEFLDILKSDEFKNRVEKLGGYELKDTGKVIIIE